MSGYTFTSSKPWHKCTRAQLLEGVEVAIEQRDKQIARAEAAESRVADLEAGIRSLCDDLDARVEVLDRRAAENPGINPNAHGRRDAFAAVADSLRALVGDETTCDEDTR